MSVQHYENMEGRSRELKVSHNDHVMTSCIRAWFRELVLSFTVTVQYLQYHPCVRYSRQMSGSQRMLHWVTSFVSMQRLYQVRTLSTWQLT